jgi:hypothetical protein
MQTKAEKKAYRKQWEINHRAERTAYSKRWQTAHKELRDAYRKQWRKTHPNAQREANHRYITKHHDEALARRRQSYATHLEQWKAYRKTHREQQSIWHKRHYATHRAEYAAKTLAKKILVHNHIGHTCRWCGETNPLFLQLDHIRCDGRQHRKEMKTNTIYQWFITNHYPTGLQVLCANCHFAKSQFEKQTHKRPVTATMVFGVARARQMARRIGSK